MSIWAKKFTIEDLNKMLKDLPTMMKHLNMEVVAVTPDSLSARIPVEDRTKQLQGLLHGGASAALAESVGSLASYLTLDGETKTCVGLDINVSHLKAVHGGFITATAKPIRLGSTIQVWEIRILNDAGDLIAFSRLTLMILNNALKQK